MIGADQVHIRAGQLMEHAKCMSWCTSDILTYVEDMLWAWQPNTAFLHKVDLLLRKLRRYKMQQMHPLKGFVKAVQYQKVEPWVDYLEVHQQRIC